MEKHGERKKIGAMVKERRFMLRCVILAAVESEMLILAVVATWTQTAEAKPPRMQCPLQ